MSETTDTPDAYMLDDNGRLFRKGRHIGDMNERNEIKLLPDKKQYAAAVTRWLRDRDEAPPEEQTVADKPKSTESSDLDDAAFARKTGCPPPPKKNPQFGDKTPAYVDWLHRYRYDAWVDRYGVIGKAKVPVVETNPDTGIEEVTGYREAYIARRKTHLTELVESGRNLGDDMDWDA